MAFDFGVFHFFKQGKYNIYIYRSFICHIHWFQLITLSFNGYSMYKINNIYNKQLKVYIKVRIKEIMCSAIGKPFTYVMVKCFFENTIK